MNDERIKVGQPVTVKATGERGYVIYDSRTTGKYLMIGFREPYGQGFYPLDDLELGAMDY